MREGKPDIGLSDKTRGQTGQGRREIKPMATIKLKTYEDMLTQFVDSVPILLKEIDANMKQLKLDGRDNDQAKSHRTRKLIKAWFSYESRRYN